MDITEVFLKLCAGLASGPLWVFVGAFVVVLTQAARHLKFIPNAIIALVTVPSGTACYVLLCDPATYGTRYPMLKAAMAGLMLSIAASSVSGVVMAIVFRAAAKHIPPGCLPSDMTKPNNQKDIDEKQP